MGVMAHVKYGRITQAQYDAAEAKAEKKTDAKARYDKKADKMGFSKTELIAIIEELK